MTVNNYAPGHLDALLALRLQTGSETVYGQLYI
jgi:hypothetical protein